MAPTKESKHDRFLRLMQKRLERSLDDLRLVSQLSSNNYEYEPYEVEEALNYLLNAIHTIAQSFGVELSTRIGKNAAVNSNTATPVAPQIVQSVILDEVEIAKALGHIRAGELTEAETILRSGLS